MSRPPADESALHAEVIEVARALIRCDTTNAREPGLGNETLAAEYLQDYLARNGVEAELVARESHRANLVARIRGVGGFETVAERPPQPPDAGQRPPQPPDSGRRPPQPPNAAQGPVVEEGALAPVSKPRRGDGSQGPVVEEGALAPVSKPRRGDGSQGPVVEEGALAPVSKPRRGDGSLAFVGHTDVVPCDPRDWTHPPFEAVVDDGGWLWGRGAVDMKNEVAARAVAMAELARTGFRPREDLWFLAVADEEDGFADVGMRWLLEERTDIRPAHSVNEGGGERFELADGRQMVGFTVGEKGTLPLQITALGEAGHASQPTLGQNAVPLLARLVERLGDGLPPPAANPVVSAMLRALLTREEPDLDRAIREASALNASLAHMVPALMGSTLAPTMLWGSSKRNVMPARATAEVDCRILPGTTQEEVEARVRALLGDDIAYEITWPEPMTAGSSSPVDGVVPAAIAAFFAAEGDPATLMPRLSTGFTDSNFLRAAAGTQAYGFSPFRSTPVDVIETGYHNANERVHVDDLLLATRFHLDLARRVLGDQP